MPNFWQRTLIGLGSAALVCLMIGMAWGPAAAFAVFSAVLLALVLFDLHNLSALYRWLRNPEPRELPDATGGWDFVFAGLYRLTKAQAQSREELSLTLARFREATAAIPDGVVILDAEDRIQWCNPVAEAQFGIRHRQDVDQPLSNLVRLPEFVAYLQAGNFREPLVVRLPRQIPVTVSVQIIPFAAGRKLLLARDITSLERAETVRRDFVANVSHELRTPLTVVGGFLESLDEMKDADPEMFRRSVELMAHQTQRMQRLVEDLLTLSQLENNQHLLREEKVNVPELLRVLQGEAQSLSAGRHRVSLDLRWDGWLLGSPDELRSAFGNLVSNAIRYTPEGGEVSLTWERDADQALFSVQDSGIGIEPQHIPRLTERFYRVDRGRSRETGGTGLGLAIVKHVLSRHQALLEISSEPGKGSRFSVRFPAARTLPRGAAVGTASARPEDHAREKLARS